MLQSTRQTIEDHGGEYEMTSRAFKVINKQHGTVQCTVPCYILWRDAPWSTAYPSPRMERVQSTIFSAVLQEFIIVPSLKESLENHGGNEGVTLQGRTWDGLKHYLLSCPSKSFISDRECSRVPFSVTYRGAKHHGADLFIAKAKWLVVRFKERLYFKKFIIHMSRV